MSAVDEIVTRLEDASADVCSDKVTQRNKAIEQVKQIFDSNFSLIQTILTGATRSSLTPKYLFSNVVNGLFKHATRLEMSQSQRTDNKAPVFITIIQYLIDYCNRLEANRLPSSLIFESISGILEDNSYSRQYGLQFLNILTVYLSGPNQGNFYNIDKGIWRRLLDGCRSIFEVSGPAQLSHVVHCFAKVLELGSKYSYLADVVVDFVPFVECLFRDCAKAGNVLDVLPIGFTLSKIMCASYTHEMSLFTVNVGPSVVKAYKVNMKEEIKSPIFEFLHMTMVIHEPHFVECRNQKCTSEWLALRGSIERVVECELNHLQEYKLIRDQDILPNSLASCAGYLYFLLLRSPPIEEEEDEVMVLSDDDEEDVRVSPKTKSKRIRKSSQLERLIGKVRPHTNTFHWRWLIVLGSAFNVDNTQMDLPQRDLEDLIRLCSVVVRELSYERQFQAIIRILNYLWKSTNGQAFDWLDIADGALKCAVKYDTPATVELLHYCITTGMCPPKLILLIHQTFSVCPASTQNFRTMTLIRETDLFKEVIGNSVWTPEQIVNYVNSNGHFTLNPSSYANVVNWILSGLNIRLEKQSQWESLGKTPFEEEVEDILMDMKKKTLSLDHKQLRQIPQKTATQVKATDLNTTLAKRFIKCIFVKADKENIPVQVELSLRYLEFSAMFLSELSSAIDFSESSVILEYILTRIGTLFNETAVEFQSQISKDGSVVRKILRQLDKFLAVDYTKSLRPVLISSKFIHQVVIWTHHQFVQVSGEISSEQEEQNTLVFRVILRLSAIQEGVLSKFWFEGEMNSFTSIETSLSILKNVPEMNPNLPIIKILITELEDIFSMHYKNERIILTILEILTKLMVHFKEHPNTCNDWSPFVKKFILWGCKQKFSPQMTIQLLELYETFIMNFFELRDFTQELQDYMLESINLFLVSKNLRIKMKTVEVLTKICNTREVLFAKTPSFYDEYSRFVHGLVVNIPWGELKEVDSVEREGRKVSQDLMETCKGVLHRLIFGLCINNEALSGYLLNILVKFHCRNPKMTKGHSDPKDAALIHTQMKFLIGSILERGVPINSFPHSLLGLPFPLMATKYQKEIGMHLLRVGPWKDFVDFYRRNQLGSLKSLLSDTLLVFHYLPGHKLHKTENFSHNIDQLVTKPTRLSPNQIVAITRSLHELYTDHEQFYKVFGLEYRPVESVDPFAINLKEYKEIVAFLDSQSNGSFIHDICIRLPHSILLILSEIQERVQGSSLILEKLENLQRIIEMSETLMSFVIKAAANEQIEHYKCYFVKDILLFTLKITCTDKALPTHVKTSLLRWILQYFKRTLSHCLKMYKENLNQIVLYLIELSEENDSTVNKSVGELLNYIIVESRGIFADTLEKLDVIPPCGTSCESVIMALEPVFNRDTITEQIKQFLMCPRRNVYSLRHLRKKIEEQEMDFVKLFKGQKELNDPRESSRNLARKLVLSLLMSVRDGSEEIRVEASQILGLFGPVDLNSLILDPESQGSGLKEAFDSESSVRAYFLPFLVESLQELQYQYVPNLPSLILKALVPLLGHPEAEPLIKSRKDLLLFQQTPATEPDHPQDPVSEMKLFSKFTVKQFSETTFDGWILANLQLFLKYSDNTTLYPIVEKLPSFGKKVFPFLVAKILASEEEPVKLAMEDAFNNFFSDFEGIKSKETHGNIQRKSLLLNEELLTLVLELVEIIRIYNQTVPKGVNLNYLSIGAAAQYCGHHSSAILYGELWAEQEMLSRKCSEKDLPMEDLRLVMIPSYEALGISDSVKPFLDLDLSRHKYYTMENAWEFAYLEATTCRSAITESLSYEAIWRMGDWDQVQTLALNPKERIAEEQPWESFHKSHCLALKFLHSGDLLESKRFLNLAQSEVILSIAKLKLDCTKNIHHPLAALKQIHQLQNVLEDMPRNCKEMLEKWVRFDQLQANTFEQQEKILVQRISILRALAGQKGVPSVVEKQTRLTLLQLIRMAKEDRNFRAAVTNLKTLENMDLDAQIKAQMLLEDGHLQFIAGHSKLADHLYSKLIHDPDFQGTFSRVSALLLMAEYLTENLMVNHRDILKTYLEPAEQLFKEFSSEGSASSDPQQECSNLVAERVKIVVTTAKFADSIYTQRNNYIKSSEYQEKKKLHSESRAEYDAIDRTKLVKSSDSTEKLRVMTLRQTIALEENQLKTVADERQNYLHLALKMYTKSCILREELNDLQICRVVSLWFTNISDAFVGELMQRYLKDVPSYKFLMILPQIAARLSHGDSVMTKIISEILVRCCREHPHHAIYHVLALHNAYADNRNAEISSSMKTRITNTEVIMKALLGDKTGKRIVEAAHKFAIALIKLANREVRDATDTKIGSELMNLNDTFRIAVPTVEIPVKISQVYSEFPYVVSWVPKFEMVGGINCPKKLTFRCSDGVSRSMLVKGKDDLRQDAVMQQVFHFMNVLLLNRKASLQRKLSIRTYKITPLTQMSGVLEFCGNTDTLGRYLIQAHDRHRPEDLKVAECRKMMTEVAKATAEEKLKRYESVCRGLSPVFQNFFTENFFSPVDWLERRMYYINSVATTSMVGYIMGIGDRHVNNILIDKTTAEVIHIDFGIALERGKLLPTPERVPFRLTRDLVAAMGCFGVDGLFRTSCEITMQVLRENKALINTIVEVFLYDPLYTWYSNKKRTTTTKRGNGEQSKDDDEKNALATRVLIRLNEKLNGQDENDTATIETQVERLIRQAMNPMNQCQMFHGWQPYL